MKFIPDCDPEIEELMEEYRPYMSNEMLHAWAQDVIALFQAPEPIVIPIDQEVQTRLEIYLAPIVAQWEEKKKTLKNHLS